MRLKSLILVWACAYLSVNVTALTADSSSHTSPTKILSRPSASLTALVEQVLLENPRILAARSAVNAAKAHDGAAKKPLFNPELFLDAENAVDQTTSIGLFQTIDWANKREARTQVSSFELEASRATLARVSQDLSVEVLALLADYHTAVALDGLANERLGLMQRFVSLTETGYRAGDLSQVDVELARLALINAKLRKAQSAVALADVQQKLVAVVGSSRSPWPALLERLPALDLAQVDVEAVLRALPALRAEQEKVAATRAVIEVRKRERQPDPTLGLRAGQEDSEALVGLTFSMPLFVRNDFRAQVDAANADLIEAQGILQNSYRRAHARLISSAERYQLTRKAWLDWQQVGEVSLTRHIELLQRIRQAGEVNTTEYLVQLNQALDTRKNALDLRGRFWRDWFDWLAASGQVETWLGLNPKHPNN